jgi:P27 family predicted phage terminase small subunit
MARPREPVELIMSKGKKHLTKEEIKERLETEVQPCTNGIEPPPYLTKRQRAEFEKLANQLQNIKIMGETDCDALARLVIAQELYVQITKKVQTALRRAVDFDEVEALSKLQDRYFRQAQTAARDLGLTIGSRCKLSVPQQKEEEGHNKFSRFVKAADDG